MPVTTLTLHHILPYLPFGLQVQSGGSVIRTLVMCPERNLTTITIHNLLTGIGHKPLLYSLDDYQLTDLIKICPNNDYVHWEVGALADGKIDVSRCSYAAIQAMAEAHIDFFNLIPAGLAVRKEPLK